MIIVGASGHGKCVFDVLEDKGLVEAFYDDNPREDIFMGKPVHLLGNPIPWQGKKDGFIAVGNNRDRMQLANRLEDKLNFLTTLHSSVISSFNVDYGRGVIVMEGAIIKVDSLIGDHVIINTGSSIDHDCKIGSFVHIAPQATLCGNIELGEGAMIGAGAVILPGIKIGNWAMVGAGSVVHHDIPDGGKWIGNKGIIAK